jgi:transposase
MPPISLHTKVYLARNAADMRKSFHGLITLTEAVLRKDPASGHLFVFLNAFLSLRPRGSRAPET